MTEEDEISFYRKTYRKLFEVHLSLMLRRFEEGVAKTYADILASNDVRWIGRRLNPMDQFRELIAHERDVLRRFLSGETGKLLDVGAGYGRLLPVYLEIGFDVTAVEKDPAARAILIEKGVKAYDADAAHLPFSDGEFDVLVMILVIHEVPQEERFRVLSECCRVLKEGGIAIIGEHRAEGFDPDWLLTALPEVGLEIEEIERREWRFAYRSRERVLMKCRKTPG